MATEGDTSGEHQAIGPTTRTKLTLSQQVTLIGGAIALTLTGAAVFYALKARADAQDAKEGALEGAFKRHVEDLNAHMPENFQRGHGTPVGSFDFQQTLSAITLEIDELKKRPFVLDGDTCRQVKGGTLCQQKYPP